ncbi:SIR2 family protein [Bradyrhizobium sp. RDI18]|uniref:SIR2 family protein n=1 Tax=Bradyrhizobium sp. RDI18 TaxID=3367400 RepID=UPI003712C2A1
MTHSTSVALLRSLLTPDNDARPTFLFGAGASFSSGIPLAGESVNRLAKQVYADRVLGGKTLTEQIKVSEWTAWLQGQSWFVDGAGRLAENFPLLIQDQLRPEAYRRNALLGLVALKQELGPGYRAVAELVLRGLAGTILTTNFDVCLPKALNEKLPHIRYVAEVNRGPDDFNEYNPFARAQIVWLHGKAEQYTDRNLVSETQTLDPELVRKLTPLLDATPLIVVGYRGAEPSITKSLLGEDTGLKFRQGIYWCHRPAETPHPNVEALAQRLGSNFRYLEIDGFDELFVDLNTELAGIQRFASADAPMPTLQFDDEPVLNATWADVDTDLALTTLRQYCTKLNRGPIDSSQLKPLMRELGLLVRVEDDEKPSAACILLFGRDMGRFFSHNVITGTVTGKKRKVFNGNLLSQYKAVLEWFDEEQVNPPIKVKVRRQHETRKSYPDRALIELLVNMIVHRDFSIARPSQIDVVPNRSIRFINPGSRLPSAMNRLTLGPDGAFEPVPQFSELRNRALCDVFFGISAMERAGTGLTDTCELAAEIGGAATFAYPPGEDSFSAELFRIEASAGSTTVARDTRPVGTYVLNLLSFASTPQNLTHIPIEVTGWSELERKVPLEEAGTFVYEWRTGDLWSLMPEPLVKPGSNVRDLVTRLSDKPVCGEFGSSRSTCSPSAMAFRHSPVTCAPARQPTASNSTATRTSKVISSSGAVSFPKGPKRSISAAGMSMDFSSMAPSWRSMFRKED